MNNDMLDKTTPFDQDQIEVEYKESGMGTYSSKMNILLVDDRSENLLALEAILDEPDYQLVKAASGSEALKHLLTTDFAVILLDVQMPLLDGFETASLIRKRKKSRHIPIIFITAINKEESYVYKGYSIGAVDYIFKPLDADILRAKIAVFAELFRKNQQIRAQAELLRQSEQRERDRKLLEAKRNSERHYRNLADAVPQIIWTANASGRISYFNQRWFDYTGLSQDDGSQYLESVLHPADLVISLDSWKKTLKTSNGSCFEARLRNKEGNFRWHLVQTLPEYDSDNRITGWLGTATDIDDQKRHEQLLTSEKERLSVTLRSIGDGVITTDIHGRITLMNRAAEVLTGWTQAEAVEKLWADVVCIRNETTRKAYESPIDKVLRTGQAVELGGSVMLIAKDQSEHLVADSSAPILNANNEIVGAVLVFRDITDKKRLEEERQKASRLESIGLLAGAIAHDFNNILTAIMGNISLAKLYTQADAKVIERLTEAEKAAVWAKDLTQQLLTFSKGGAPIKKTTVIVDLIRDAAQFASRGSHVRCEFALSPRLSPVDVDEGQLRQVIHNLVINAQQAMPESGKVVLSAENVTVRREHKLPLTPGNYVKISCKDTGVGISADNLPKIFDPYFTTKQRGSGLGLATSYSIIKRHDGIIIACSEVGVGTTFDIYLPVSNRPPELVVPAAPPVSLIANTTSRTQGKILIMDDEAFIRDLLGRLFTYFGYAVGFAEDGMEALALYKQALMAGQPFDVVIMDLIIPGAMGGKETIGKLLEIDPNARAIVSSGYSNDPIMADFRRYGFCEAVAKPYKNEELANVVQKVITHPQPAARIRKA